MQITRFQAVVEAIITLKVWALIWLVQNGILSHVYGCQLELRVKTEWNSLCMSRSYSTFLSASTHPQ